MNRADCERLWAAQEQIEVSAKRISPCFLKRFCRDAWLAGPIIALLALAVVQVHWNMSPEKAEPGMCHAILGSSVFNAAVVVVLVTILFDRTRSIWILCKIRLSLLRLSRHLGVLRGETQDIIHTRGEREFCERLRLLCRSKIGPTRTGIEAIDGLIQRVHSLGQYHEEAAVIESLWRMIDDLKQELCSFSFSEMAKVELVLEDLPEDQKRLHARTMGTALEDIPKNLRGKLWRICYLCGKCPEAVCDNIAAGIRKGHLGKPAKWLDGVATGSCNLGGRRFMLQGIPLTLRKERSREPALADRMTWVCESLLFDLTAEHSDCERAQEMVLKKIINLRDQLINKPDDELTSDEKSKRGHLNQLVKEVQDVARRAAPEKPE